MAQRSRSNPSLLLVEDSPNQLDVFASLFASAGFSVFSATSGSEAMARLQQHAPDLLVIDMNLPDTTGSRLCAAIRRFSQWATLPVLVLTVQSGTDVRVAAFEAGADDYVDKGTDPLELIARARRLLSRRQTETELTEHERLDALQRAARTMAHGLNSPLQVVTMGIDVIGLLHASSEETHTVLEKMAGGVSRIRDLVARMQQLAAITRPECMEPDGPEEPQDPRVARAEARHRGRNYSVLVVEDAELLRMVIRQSLENSGRFQVLEAQDGRAGLEMARAELPDLILSDVMMPGMGGFEFCAALKQDPILKNIPFIFLTVHSALKDILKGFDLGAAGYLLKPIDPEVLPEKIFRTLERLGVGERELH